MVPNPIKINLRALTFSKGFWGVASPRPFMEACFARPLFTTHKSPSPQIKSCMKPCRDFMLSPCGIHLWGCNRLSDCSKLISVFIHVTTACQQKQFFALYPELPPLLEFETATYMHFGSKIKQLYRGSKTLSLWEFTKCCNRNP